MNIKAAYQEAADKNIRCTLCPANCILSEGKTGICSSRTNINGELICTNYGEVVSAGYDPIEKKPLYHFHPGSIIFSTGANGCNFKCANCQNFEISQNKVPTKFVSPEELVKLAGDNNSIGVAYTYSEPLIWFEYIMAVGKLIHEAELKNVLVTNGYINHDPLEELLPLIDAANVDLKSMRPDFYKKICKGNLDPVLENIERFYHAGVALEITNLVIPDLNDSDEDIRSLVDFVASISKEIPLHFSAYYPTYRMNNHPTPPEILLRAYELASERLDYVYLGNVRLTGKADTYCPSCKNKIIDRAGYDAKIINMRDGRCLRCGTKPILHN